MKITEIKENLIEQSLIKLNLTFLLLGIFVSSNIFSQLPTAAEIASEMTIGWNIGNSLEATPNETGWGNPKINQDLIDAVKDAGFNTIRIPCAWDSHANQSTLQIDVNWLNRVKEVVDYCYANDMYVMINVHWDGGWLENNVTTGKQESVNAKQHAYWTQIAEYFKDYDEHLLFAGTNEPNVDNAAQMGVLLTYLQTFIDAVRATGGNNSSRTLIIQGPSTDIDKTNRLMTTLPTDQIENRLMAEVHFYTPWNFCGLEKDESWGKMFYYWGKDNHSTTDPSRNPTWGEESAVDTYLKSMKSKFVDNGIPVVLGEYGAIKRTSLSAEDLELHIKSREYYYKYVTAAAVSNGIIPVYWDNGYGGNNGFALFTRSNGSIIDQGALDALMEGVAVSTSVDDKQELENKSVLEFVTASPNPSSNSTEIQFFLKESGLADISVFNIIGQQVAHFNDLNFGAGLNSVNWYTADLSSGIYVVNVNIGRQLLTGKVLIVR